MKTELLQIRIDPELKKKLKRLAESEGKGISEFVTDLIKKEIWKREG